MQENNKKVAFHTLGCKVNIYETEAMKELIKKAGYEIVEFEEKADIYIINTCSVTNMADKKSRQVLHKAKKENKDAVVVAVGCYVQSAKEKLKEDNKIDIIVGNNKKKEIVSILNEYYRGSSENEYIIDINKTNEYEDFSLSRITDYTRAFVKIQDGCNQFCSYCIIPYTRGRVRSRKVEDIVLELNNLAKKGFKEVVLTGIHLSSYGVDLEKGNNLLKLITEISKIEGIKRIRIGSLEPRIITKEFLDGISKIDKFCPHFHLSLQSASNKTLKAMNRAYTIEEFFEGVRLIREYYESPAISTDVIVGFPTEEVEDFIESRDNIEKLSFYEMHIFPYSKREGTRAAKMKEKLTNKEKSERAKELALINEVKSKEFREKRINKVEEILIEEKIIVDDEEYAIGHTKEYIKIAIKIDKDIEFYSNKFVKGLVSSKLKDDILLIKDYEIYE